MAGCLLGKKKHKKCEDIAGREFEKCIVRGGYPVGYALCVWTKEDGSQGSQWVQFKTGKTQNMNKEGEG